MRLASLSVNSFHVARISNCCSVYFTAFGGMQHRRKRRVSTSLRNAMKFFGSEVVVFILFCVYVGLSFFKKEAVGIIF